MSIKLTIRTEEQAGCQAKQIDDLENRLNCFASKGCTAIPASVDRSDLSTYVTVNDNFLKAISGSSGNAQKG
ncbi:hypothetical protein, partial [Catenovulum sediminis]